MTASRPDIEAIFHAARDIPDPAPRGAYVREACGGDETLISHVEALLAAADAPDSLLDRPAGGLAATSDEVSPGHWINPADLPPPSEAPGSRIGPYKLLEQIGEGGMGTVWMAEQTEPIQRRVAVKVVKEGMDSRQVLARFEAERQALALMEHPNIARVLDAGKAPSGRPYFVMELVKGQPITRYCDEKRLGVRERLQLLGDVCRAVQHAHQKGIIHRDLKPSNVLVAPYDGKPVVKVIDFGVAKATGQRLTDKTLFTGFGTLVGTPEYMSPEQAEVNNQDIDTRSDIYSLGVLLYELLTGSTPLTRQRIRETALPEVLRVIREEEPPKPSTKLSSSDALPTLAANRGTEPAKLANLVRGELDWIVMKALEKDRNRRYETANGFATDVQRYLAGEPVLAAPASRWYRLRKFVRRNRGPVIAASLVLLALVAGVIGTTVGMLEANRAAEQERQAKVKAEQNLAFARKGNEILGSVFAGLHPRQIVESGRPLHDVLRENLGKAVKELEGSAIGDPLEVAAMQNTLGVSLLALAEYPLAVEVLDKAFQTRQAMLGPDHPDTLTSMNNLARGYDATRQFDKALPLFEETLKLRQATLSPDHPDTLSSMNNLAAGYSTAGQLDKALPLWEETLELQKAKLDPDHPDTLNTMHNLATGYYATRQFDKALPLFEETLKLRQAKLVPDHPDTLLTMNNLATAYFTAGQVDKALPLFEETLKQRKAKLGPDHPDTLTSMHNLAATYWRLNRLDQSIPLFEMTLQLREKKIGRQQLETLTTMAHLGMNYKDASRLKEAIPLLEEAYQAGKQYPSLRWVGQILLDAYARAGETAKWADLVREGLPNIRQALPKDSPQLANLLAQIGLGLLEQQEWAEAEPLLRECLTIREKTQPDVWNTFNAQAMLGAALLGQKKHADAEPLLRKGYEGMKQREEAIPSPSKKLLPETIGRLIELYSVTNRPEEAKRWQAERAKDPSEKK
jgi:serine/threonine protein kinase/tetratricopeptide (TPR) repeat protein